MAIGGVVQDLGALGIAEPRSVHRPELASCIYADIAEDALDHIGRA
jgi:hypothetical protein